MEINIGNRDLKTITKEELRNLMVVDGLFKNSGIDGIASPWNDAVIDKLDWCDETLWFYGTQTRKEDGKVLNYKGYFSIDNFHIHYENDVRRMPYLASLQLVGFNHLIKKGFNLPIATFKG